VENDPVLRSMMTVLLEGLPAIEVMVSVEDSAAALEVDGPLDVALLDRALGPESLNGVALGHALRAKHEDIGIVILSQHYA
jgi:DNA-binding NarL/FixJ family response regulator